MEISDTFDESFVRDPENPSTFSENEPIIPLRSTHDDVRRFGSILERDFRTMKENLSRGRLLDPPIDPELDARNDVYSPSLMPS